jgi:hypothetical protein
MVIFDSGIRRAAVADAIAVLTLRAESEGEGDEWAAVLVESERPLEVGLVLAMIADSTLSALADELGVPLADVLQGCALALYEKAGA